MKKILFVLTVFICSCVRHTSHLTLLSKGPIDETNFSVDTTQKGKYVSGHNKEIFLTDVIINSTRNALKNSPQSNLLTDVTINIDDEIDYRWNMTVSGYEQE